MSIQLLHSKHSFISRSKIFKLAFLSLLVTTPTVSALLPRNQRNFQRKNYDLSPVSIFTRSSLVTSTYQKQPTRQMSSFASSPSSSSNIPSTSSEGAAKRGVFILFEGIDRCGKSTQSALLAKYLATRPTKNNDSQQQDGDDGHSAAELIRFPDRTSTIGTLINSYLASTTDMSDQTIHLLFSANRWEAAKGLENKLKKGQHLVCDRYAYSGVAFSSAKGLSLDWCKAGDVGLPAPDCVIYLDMPVEDAAKRGNFGEERYEKIDFQLKVRDRFMSLMKEDEQRLPWYLLDARKSIEELQAEVGRFLFFPLNSFLCNFILLYDYFLFLFPLCCVHFFQGYSKRGPLTHYYHCNFTIHTILYYIIRYYTSITIIDSRHCRSHN